MYSLKIHRNIEGNWALEPSPNLANHSLYPFPPMAFPGSLTLAEVQRSAAAMLPVAHVPAPDTLNWTIYGHTPDGTYAYQTRWSVTVQSLSPKGA